METKRAPLANVNAGSRIPAPGSRLPMPGSKLRPPSTVSAIPNAAAKRKPTVNHTEKEIIPAKKVRPETKKPASTLASRSSGSRRSLTRSSLNSSIGSNGSRRTGLSTRPGATKATSKTGTSANTRKPAISQTAGTSKAPIIPGGKRREKWDVKGRLLDMEAAMVLHKAENSQLQNQVLSNNNRILQLESRNQQLEGTVQQKERQTNMASQEIEALQKKLRTSEEELISSTRKMKMEIEDERFARERVERQKSEVEGELAAARHQVAGMQTEIAILTSSQATLKSENEHTKRLLEEALEAGRMKDSQIAELRALVAKHEQTIEECQQAAREHETERRYLHNVIQELKGNIRVFCRVRPLLGNECLGNNGVINHMGFPDDGKTLEVEKLAETGPNESVANFRKNSDNSYEFKFDRVFNPESTQAEVFNEISQLVQSALDGYNVCIFAYGQTGSGKTHTMEGGEPGDHEMRGMIPRAVEQIFKTAQSALDKGWKYEFEATFLEIYNETIRDLLGDHKEDLKHEIKMVTANSLDVTVTNVTSVKVQKENQVFQLLKKASENRAVAETKCNERSSRSHSVFRLKLIGHNSHTDEHCAGLLNLIDLAGSERLKDSQSQGARLTETKNINKSLANLGNVIMALANKDSHIPYRNSKLTHLLQNSLGGNSKTLMFVNVSPKEECFQETMCSLRFATKVNNCNIGTAQKRTK